MNRINYVEKNIVQSLERSQKVMDFYDKRSNDIRRRFKNIVFNNFPDLFETK